MHEALRACTIGFAKLWLVPAAGSATALDAAPRSASSLARSGRDSGEIRPGARSSRAPPEVLAQERAHLDAHLAVEVNASQGDQAKIAELQARAKRMAEEVKAMQRLTQE